ncbi:ABC transporter substrate-binding protein [Nonomuraea sp. MG754425]|uniref:ABC transporter substrate-binding protein n=1 Tax=Nonomuraea sp. MG754425 TaxID=2570319 RepID=UPI001F34AC15|nr:ABC transporter substrate-binding protein [Nonomuraea sp. MG754425]
MRRATAIAALVLVMAAGCTGTEGAATNTTAARGMVDFLDYGDFGGGAEPQANYNPYLTATHLGAVGYLFEKLVIFNKYSCEPVPWLAESFAWADPRTLTFKIRQSVQWSDGRPLTAKDVDYSYNLIKKHEALDTAGVWRYIKSVTTTAPDTITMTFKEPGAAAFTKAVDVPIVPEHIWSTQADPVTFVNADKPVGTGPYLVKSFNRQQLAIERNPRYWQADKIKVQEIRFHKADGGGSIDQLKLSRGEYDHNAMFVPDVKKAFVDRDPEHNHYWYPPGGVIAVYLNLTKAPFDDLAFRKALTTAFDHKQIIDKAQYGYVRQASQTGLIVPGQNAWLPQGIADEGRIPYDAAKADAALTTAGYAKDAKGRRLGKDGKPIAFAFKVPGEWTDWLTAAQITVKNLTALGFDVNLETPDFPTFDSERAVGDFDMLYGVFGGSCNMYQNFADPLSTAQSAPIGKKAAANHVRWNDPETDRLVEQLRVSPDESVQKQAVAGLAKIMMDQVPVIPLWYGAKWFQYRTAKAVGWPSEQDPYAAPGDDLLIITRLRPA